MINKIHWYLIAYLVFLVILAPIHLLSFDTYYYWDWSRHLALSYYDGSPMVAYWIRAATLLFGHTLFAFSMLGIIVTGLTSLIIYKTARFFLNIQSSYVAVLLWLFSPLVTLDLLNQVTLNTPLTFFWALTIYYSIKYIKYNAPIYLYYIGGCIGLMMLSKYSGVVLVIAIFIFLIFTPYRKLFKSYHIYLACLLAILLFAPVILWNQQHSWQSFTYQLATHKLHTATHPIFNISKSFFTIFLISLNFLLVTPFIWCIQKNLSEKFLKDSNNFPALFCFIICITFLIFYLSLASVAKIRGFWLEQYLISACLLAGYCFQHFNYRSLTRVLIITYALASILILLNSTTLFNLTNSNKIRYYQWMQHFNTNNIKTPKAVISSGWFEARGLFFLKNHPLIYTMNCGGNENQYAEWSSHLKKIINKHQLSSIWYIDVVDRSACIRKFFDRCTQDPLTNSIMYRNQPVIYAYLCENNQ